MRPNRTTSNTLAASYRSDIDGLRAVAVLAVVLFHLDIHRLAGGYVGVDVFFVISGFLITGLIRRDWERGSFSFLNFYARRVRRLLPAVIATVVVTFAVSAALMTPYDLVAFSRSAIAALFSLSNFVFYFEAGYWDATSELKPLLHTWSLGVEEQFYLFWPALTVALLKLQGRISMLTSLLLLFFGGTALCIWYTYVDPHGAFYLLPFRVFQFAAGALIPDLVRAPACRALVAANGARAAAGYAGMGLILAAVLFFDGSTLFPGWAVLAPTVGTMLVLLAGCGEGQQGFLRALLQHPLSLWLGKVSYAMYLVHWPLVALYRYHFGLELRPVDQGLLALATLASAVLLHYGVERRFYQRSGTASGKERLPAGRFALATLVCAALVAIAPAAAWRDDGWPGRFPGLALGVEEIERGKRERTIHYGPACTLTAYPDGANCAAERPLQVLVLGNSHEIDGYNFVRAAWGGDDSVNLITWGSTANCRMKFAQGRISSRVERCQAQLDSLADADKVSGIDIVVYSANRPFHSNKEMFQAILERLRALNPQIRIVTIGGYINTRLDCAKLVNLEGGTDACRKPENVVYFAGTPEDEPLRGAIMALSDAYIDRVALLCPGGQLSACLVQAPNGAPAFYDTHHLSLPFAEMTGSRYARQEPTLLHDLHTQGRPRN